PVRRYVADERQRQIQIGVGDRAPAGVPRHVARDVPESPLRGGIGYERKKDPQLGRRASLHAIIVASGAPKNNAALPTTWGAALPTGNVYRALRDVELGFGLIEELLVLGRILERGRRRLAALDRRRHRVEVARPHLALMLDRGESFRDRGEFGFLQLDERRHVLMRIAMGEVEHRVVEAVEARER